MNKHEVIIAAVRLIAIWVFMLALKDMIFFLSQTQGLRIFNPDMSEGKLLPVVWTSQFSTISFQVFFAALLWTSAIYLARFILRVYDPNGPSVSNDLIAWFSIAIALVGIYLLAQTIKPLMLSGTMFLSQNFDRQWMTAPVQGIKQAIFYTMAQVLSAALQLALGVLLIVRSHWLAKTLAKWQRWESGEGRVES